MAVNGETVLRTCKKCAEEFPYAWRVSVRPPTICPSCKADPSRAGRIKADKLQARLLDNGRHLSQHSGERRSYSIAELEQRITELERWRASIEPQVPAPTASSSSPDPSPAQVPKPRGRRTTRK